MIDPWTYWARTMESWRVIGATGDMMARTAAASKDVIAARTVILQTAARSPLEADHAEIWRMTNEKAVAFSAAGEVALTAWWKAWADGAALAGKMTARSSRVPTPFSAFDWWSEIGLGALRAAESGSRAGRDTLAPIHRAATANARRLSGRAGTA